MFRKMLLAVAVVPVLMLGTTAIAQPPAPPYPQPYPQPYPPQPQPLPQPYPPLPQQPYPPQPYPPQPYPPRPLPQPRHYHVHFRTCEHERWQSYGTFDCHEEAHQIARSLRRQGYQAKVIHH